MTPTARPNGRGNTKIMDSEEKIPFVAKAGPLYYNFWRDAHHPRGVWRRTTLEEYRQPQPQWEVVLDLDALGKAEKESWVWHGSSFLRPSCKMVAKMKEMGHDVLYYENIEGGHGAAADNKQAAFMSALAYTFLWNQLQ